MAVCRGSALGLCVLLILNLAEIFIHSTSPVDNWLCNIRPVPNQVAIGFLAMGATCLLLFSMRPALPGPVWFSTGAIVLMFVAGCGREIWTIQQTVPEPDRITAMLKPLGVTMLFLVAGIGVLTGNSTAVQGRSSFFAIITSAGLAFVSFAVVAVQSGGLSDGLPETTVPFAFVQGAPPNSDGTATDELTDRMTTAVDLVKDRKARKLYLNSGSSADNDSAGESMKLIAIAAGLEESSIVLNDTGRGDSDIRTAIAALSQQPELKNKRDAIVIDHWYELARCRMLAKRNGLSPIGIAAHQQHALFNQNTLVAKEVLALMKTLCDPAVQFVKGIASGASPDTTADGESEVDKDAEPNLDYELENLRSMEL